MHIVWLNAAEKAAGMRALGARIGTHHAFDWADDVAEAGEDTIKNIARVDTGLMKSSVGKSSTAMSGVGVAEAGYGLQQAHPFYTKFQEFGTRHGIKPMNSIVEAARSMNTEIDNAGIRMIGRIAAEWDSI